MQSGASLRPFAGRVRELWLADALLGAATAGEGRLMVVLGEAGIGKSRFCEEVAARAKAAGASVAWGRCWPGSGAPSAWPWQEILARFGLTLPDDSAVSAVPNADTSRFAWLAATLGLLRSIAETHERVVIILEDLHDAEPGALLLTRFIARSLNDLPIVLVTTWRTDVEIRFEDARLLLNDIQADGVIVELRGLDLNETAALATALSGPGFDPESAAGLHRLTRGHPLLLHALLDSGSAMAEGSETPIAARRLLDQQLDRLPPNTAQLCTMLAAIANRIACTTLAQLSERAVPDLLDTLEPALQAGVVSRDGDNVALSHEMLRVRLLERTSPSAVLALHAALARRFVEHCEQDWTGTALMAAVHHALQAASRSTQDAELAVALCSAAAKASVERFAYEQAAQLLDDAVDTQQRLVGPAPVMLLVEQAEAVMQSGRLARARALFEVAATRAMDADDRVALAVAALRVGGIWVNEHRDGASRARVRTLQLEARHRLGDVSSSLAHRLDVRLAAEATYAGGSLQEVSAAVERCRELRDGRALAEALNMYHHCLLGPDHAAARDAVAAELLDVLSHEDNGLLTLLALCWRAVDHLLVADRRAATAVQQVKRQADALQCLPVLYIVRCIETSDLIRQGRLDEAEKHAYTTYELGGRAGDADALAYLGGHLVAIRYAQGRCEELVPLIGEVAGSADLADMDHSFTAAVATAAAAAGDLGTAQQALDALARDGLSALPRMSTWLGALLGAVMAAEVVQRTALLTEAYDLLLPYRELPIRPSLAVVCFGSVEWPLGRAALALGRLDDAVEHLEAAVRKNDAFGNRPFAAIARAACAEALVRRGGIGDIDRARSLYAQAVTSARACEMQQRASEWDEALNELSRSDHQLSLLREGNIWQVRLAQHALSLPHSVGLSYLATLVSRAGQEVAAADLVNHSVRSSAHEVIDEQARAAYRAHIQTLQQAIDEADRAGDVDASARAQAELDDLLEHLQRAIGVHGRTRSFRDEDERARLAVQKALRRCIEKIGSLDPAIGDHLAAHVVTGRMCTYRKP